MRNKQEYLYNVTVECMRELDALNIQYGKVQAVTINTRAKSRWGQCSKRASVYYINIADRLLGEDVSKKALKDTLMHEIIHTCDGCMNHGTKWKSIADRVNKAYSGYDIKRCTSAEEKGFSDEEVAKEYKYIFKCEKCGAVVKRMRMSDFVKHPYLYHCRSCGGKFTQVR